jgi:hypothetical protein
MSITTIPNLGYIVKLPDNDFRVDDIFSDEMQKIDPRAIVEAVDTSHEAPSSFLVVSKIINKSSIEKCLKLLPGLAKEKKIKVKINWDKEKKESQKLIKKFKKLPACRKFPLLVSAINTVVDEAKQSYAEGEYGATSNDLMDYEYLVVIYKLLKSGHLAEAYHPIKNNLIIWASTDPNYFPLPEETRKAIEVAYVTKYQSA